VTRESLTPELRYRLLLDISEKVRGTLELERVLEQLIDAVKPLVDHDAGGVFVLNRAFRPPSHSPFALMIEGMALRGFPRRPPEKDPMLKSGKGIIGHVIRTGETVISPDVRRDPRYVEGRPGTLSEIAVPIVVGEQVIGALNLESDGLNAFGAGDAELLHFISNAAAISIEKAMLHRRLMENRLLESQMVIARQVQAGLLPGAAPEMPGFEVAALNLPNLDISGDYFDYIPLAAGDTGVVIADVSGKGVAAALIMATFRAALRTRARNGCDLVDVLRSVNELLLESIGDASFVTAVYGALTPATGRLTYANCGHNPPLLLRANGDTETLECGGLPLGVMRDARLQSASVTVERGDTLVLFTDGVIELPLANGEELGPGGLEWIVRANWDHPAARMIDGVVQATRTLTHGSGYPDDFTLVILRRLQ
jgi:phosphoserine phosphatase RsbU/P